MIGAIVVTKESNTLEKNVLCLTSDIFLLNSNCRSQAAALLLNDKIDRETKLDSGRKFGLLSIFSREMTLKIDAPRT